MAATPGLAGPPPAITGTSVETFSAGIYCPGDTVRRDPAPGTASGSINIITAPTEFSVVTQRIPAVPGLGFGVLVTLAQGERRTATITVTHPPFPGSGVAEEFWTSELDDDPSLNGFTFEHLYELQTGTWTFSAEADGEPIYSVVFEVVDPSAAPDLAELCTGVVTS